MSKLVKRAKKTKNLMKRGRRGLFHGKIVQFGNTISYKGKNKCAHAHHKQGNGLFVRKVVSSARMFLPQHSSSILRDGSSPVSYTHLTLPTILLV
eukprot:2332447-Pleurochrysis_carterae.AAC.1